ncbi:MAG: histidine ammonia-lyase [Bacteroidota bacterium]
MSKPTFAYGKDQLSCSVALSLARGEAQGIIESDTREKLAHCCLAVEQMAAGDVPVYGINTGFGPLCTTTISAGQTKILQRNLLISHAVGVGDPISIEASRLMLVLKLHALAQGFSGVSIATLERIMYLLDNWLTPVVPSKGSVGASGDLAPLAHLFLPLIGEGYLYSTEPGEGTQKFQPSKQLLDVPPLELGPKEGLGLINGTQFIAAHAVLLVERFHRCLSQADVVAAMMLEGLQGSVKPFTAELHQLRPFPANQHVAARLRELLIGSEILEDHIDCDRVQDPYSLRCMPQVHGASRTAWLHLKQLTEIEINSVTDNPVVIDEHTAISGGNFHGQPLAMALDYACLAAAEMGNISDRRVYLALEGGHGLPKLLMEDTGINSGYMILQYTTAALVSENKTLCFPASADSVPTSLGQEDHVSMGSISGRKALQVVGNLEKILGIELLTAAQAFEFRKPLRSGPLLEEVHNRLRKLVPFAEVDRVFAPDIEIAARLIQDGQLLQWTYELAAEQSLDFQQMQRGEFETF